jgi:ribosomal protein S12 methylthiotransferase
MAMDKSAQSRQTTVGFISLGCAKNLVDSEVMLGLLGGAGYAVTAAKEDADVLVVNTCGFIQDAREESFEAIREAVAEKGRGRCRVVVVAGCLASRMGEALGAAVPGIDALVGTADYPRIAETIQATLAGQKVVRLSAPGTLTDWDLPRLLATPGYYAYLKIAEGCDCACAFCAIPLMRGRQRSRPLESLVAEAGRLAQGGVRELIVVAQDTTAYGWDLYGKARLPELLRELAHIEDLRWIRLLYSYPTRVSDALIEVMATEPRVLKYLDLPLQHGSPRMLRLMNRPADPEASLRLLEKLRASIPDICLRSTFLAGHPGETETDFKRLLEFIRAADLDHVGVFAYSPEADTPSGRMEQLPLELRQARCDEALEVQTEIAIRHNRAQIGRTLEVLVEGKAGLRPGGYAGRSYRQSPDIDGRILFTDRRRQTLSPGQFVTVCVTGAWGYDLKGSISRR